MKLVCALFGHQAVPLGSRRRAGKWVNSCMLCQQPLVHEEGGWALLELDERPALRGDAGDRPAS